MEEIESLKRGILYLEEKEVALIFIQFCIENLREKTLVCKKGFSFELNLTLNSKKKKKITKRFELLLVCIKWKNMTHTELILFNVSTYT